MLFAWKSWAKCTKMLGNEWERGCFRQTKGRRMRWNGWEKSQKHSPENAQLQQSSEAKWCKMHHLMLTFYLKGIWKTRKNLRFDGFKVLKYARMARGEMIFCKLYLTKWTSKTLLESVQHVRKPFCTRREWSTRRFQRTWIWRKVIEIGINLSGVWLTKSMKQRRGNRD